MNLRDNSGSTYLTDSSLRVSLEHLQDRLTFKCREHWCHVACEQRVCLWSIDTQIYKEKMRGEEKMSLQLGYGFIYKLHHVKAKIKE